MRIALVSLESFYDHSLALDYLVSYASLQQPLAEAVEFKIFVESEGRPFNDVVDNLVDYRPDLVGFNTYVWNVEASVAAAKALKASSPSTVVVFGGMEATFNTNKLLSDISELDFVVVGEGEISFSELLGRLLHNDKFATPPPGLAWRNRQKIPLVGGLGAVIEQIDKIPSPFQQPDYASRGVRRVLYESYRGCAFQCSFCLYQRDYAAQRSFSDDRVKADLDAILRSGATHIRFVDATFNLYRKRAKNILRHLAGCKADVCVEVSAEFFDVEMVGLLPGAGIRHVDIGLQSTQSAPLKAVHREWYRGDRFRENLERLRAEPALTLNVELIAGLPGDELDGLRRSLDEAVLTWPDHVSVYRLLGLKGTALERDAEHLGLQFSQTPPYELVGSNSFPPADLDRANELTFAHLVLFNLGIGRYALRYLVEAFDIRPCDVYDKFLEVIFTENMYSRVEARHLGRHHAYGNRFDQPMPPGLELSRVHQATKDFFEKVSFDRLGRSERKIAIELVDFGYALATLDGAKIDALATGPETTRRPRFAPWCRRQPFPTSVIAEIARQGHTLGDLTPGDVGSIVFFVHPELGPAALAIDNSTVELLDCIERGTDNIDATAVKTLQNFGILI